MKKKQYAQILAVLFALTLASGFASGPDPGGVIGQISVSPGMPSTRIVLESSSPLALLGSRYAENRPSTILIDFDGVNTDSDPPISPRETTLVKDIQVEKIEPARMRLLIDLKERVPYRIISKDNQTIVELNKIQRMPGKYFLDSETSQALEKAGNGTAILSGIQVVDTGKRVDITALLNRETVSNVFVLDRPLRLVVDLYNTYFASKDPVHVVNKLGVEKVRAAQFQAGDPYTITRLVFHLTEPSYYSLDSGKDGLTVSFFKKISAPLPQEKAVESEKKPEKPVIAEPPAREDPPLAVETPPGKKAVVPEDKTVEREKETKPPVPRESGSAKTVPREEKPVEKKAAVIETVPSKTKTETESAEAKIERPEKLRPDSSQPRLFESQEDQFPPRTIAQTERKYEGELVTLKFKDADLRDVISYLGEKFGLNVTFDPEVRGVVSCNFTDVPWDQAMDILLKQNKLGRTLEGNVLRIAPVQTLTREREEQQRLEESKELSGPLMTKSFTLSYSKAADVEGLLRNKISQRGEIIVDGRTNTLVITDVKDRISLIEKLIGVFDTPTPQVAIEARIVEATSTFIRNLGIQWGARAVADPFYGNQTSLQFPHKILVDGAMIPQGIVTKGIGGPLGGYAINLPAPAFTTAMGVSFANVLDTFRLDMAISAMETSGQGRIISSPSVTTQNNKEAEIIQGRQIPVQTVANFTVTTRYINAALELRATPQITAEGTIIMYLELRNNAADFANLVNGIPPIITQSASTTVMIPDGGTTVIGGIYRTEDSITRERVPFFHKIPILGNLFRSFARTKQSRELLIFITPRIIR